MKNNKSIFSCKELEKKIKKLKNQIGQSRWFLDGRIEERQLLAKKVKDIFKFELENNVVSIDTLDKIKKLLKEEKIK